MANVFAAESACEDKRDFSIASLQAQVATLLARCDEADKRCLAIASKAAAAEHEFVKTIASSFTHFGGHLTSEIAVTLLKPMQVQLDALAKEKLQSIVEVRNRDTGPAGMDLKLVVRPPDAAAGGVADASAVFPPCARAPNFCWDFANGSCIRGLACAWAHDGATPHGTPFYPWIRSCRPC